MLGRLLPPLLCAALAIAVRLPIAPQQEAAAPWFRGALALQGLRETTESGERDRNLVVAIPLSAGQNLAYLAARVVGGGRAGARVAWIRGHEEVARSLLWSFWILGATAATLLALRLRPGGWGVLAAVAIATVPIGIAGTHRLEGWALAAPLALAGLLVTRGVWAVLIWGALLSLTPLGFLFAALVLMGGGARERIAVLLGVPVWFALDPTRLVAPGTAIAELLHGFRVAGWPGIGDGPMLRLLLASWTPGVVAVILGMIGALGSLRNGTMRIASLASLLLWWGPAVLGAKRPDGVGLASPIALVLAAQGGKVILRRTVRGRSFLAAGLGIVLLVPLLWGARGLLDVESRRRARATEMATILATEVGHTGLLARDPATPEPPDSIRSFLFPTHAKRPEVWDFAYWPGWYGRFTHMLFLARTLESLETASPRERPGARALVSALATHARPVRILGDPVTDGGALVLFALRQGPPWEPDNRRELWDGLSGGATEAPFLGDLAAYLAEHGEVERAMEVLRVAIRWDPSSPRLANNLGTALLMAGELPEAAEVLTEALRRSPSSVDLRHTLAVVYLEMEVPGRALNELRLVLSARPNDARSHYDFARAAAAMKKWGLAARALETYLALEPNPPDRDRVLESLDEARRLAGTEP